MQILAVELHFLTRHGFNNFITVTIYFGKATTLVPPTLVNLHCRDACPAWHARDAESASSACSAGSYSTLNQNFTVAVLYS